MKKAMGHPPRQKGALGLGRVNGHHERMKTLINRVLRCVSTKYLPDYLAMLRLVCRPPIKRRFEARSARDEPEWAARPVRYQYPS